MREEEPSPDLERLIDAVSDGLPVDWETEAARRPDLRADFDELRLMESIAAAHRASWAPTDPGAPVSWGPLEVLNRLGGNGAADVYRALDLNLRTEVALKLLRPGRGDERRILHEGQRMARVRHHNVLVVHGADRHEERTGIWTELIRGRTLEECLKESGPFGSREAIGIGLDLCRALAAVHAAGIVHRDVKTQNVMRERGGRIVLMDFGAGVERVQLPGDPIAEDGTPLVMAPEELRSEPSTPASDIYSLGVLLYRLVTHRLPVEAHTYAELHDHHDRGVRVPLRDRRPDLPASFIQVVERALEPRPESRFASAGEFERALLEAERAHHGFSARRLSGWLAAAALVIAIGWLGIARPWERASRLTGETGTPAISKAPEGLAPAVTPEPGGAGAVTARAAVPLVASAALVRERDGQDQALAPGERIAPGEGLALKFKADEPVHAYVLGEDADGEVYVMFPSPGLEPANPLPAGILHRLPGRRAGRPLNWRVTSAGGKETVIVIATREPFAALERAIAGFPRPTDERPVVYGKLEEGAITELRGIGGFMESGTSGDSRPAARLSQVLARLEVRNDAAAPWTWQIELANPP